MGRHGHEERKSTKEARDAKPKAGKVKKSKPWSTWVNKEMNCNAVVENIFDGDKDGGDENVVHEEDGGNMNDDDGKTMDKNDGGNEDDVENINEEGGYGEKDSGNMNAKNQTKIESVPFNTYTKTEAENKNVRENVSLLLNYF
ncbi:hypothetical protein Tco_1539414 [Tanacetum coccineum]